MRPQGVLTIYPPKALTSSISTLLVPQGAEHRAICQGLRGLLNPPTVLSVPASSAPLVRYLEQLQQSGCLYRGQTVLLMGLCGGLIPELAVGDAVIYRQCVARSPLGLATIPCDRALTDWLEQKLADRSLSVTGVTSDRVISTPTAKRQLAQQTQAAVVDMEGFAAITYLHEIGVSAAILRIVSDDCHRPIPDLSAVFDSDGRLRPLILTMAMLRQPFAAAHLIQGSLKGLRALQAIAQQLCSPEND